MENRNRQINSIETAEIIHNINKDGQPSWLQTMAEDPDTGMVVWHQVYKAGTVTTKHRHTCGHGIYVLSGHLVTDKGIIGPGEMVWFPAGEIMSHGAPEDEDCEHLFITNKAFDIEYLDD